MKTSKYYVVIPKLRAEQQEAFNVWMVGKTRPTIEVEGKYKYDCAFISDYEYWLQYIYKSGQPVPVIDDSSPINFR